MTLQIARAATTSNAITTSQVDRRRFLSLIASRSCQPMLRCATIAGYFSTPKVVASIPIFARRLLRLNCILHRL